MFSAQIAASEVRFITSWQDDSIENHPQVMDAIELYIAQAGACGFDLPCSDIAEDLNERYGYLGAITLSRSNMFGRSGYVVRID